MSEELFQKKHCDSKQLDDEINSGEVNVAVSSSQKRVHHRDKKFQKKIGERKRERDFGIKKIEYLIVTYHIMEYQIDHLLF